MYAPSTKDDGAVVCETGTEEIGGSFTARLDMNLREDKHWSYGARSMLADAEGQRTWLAYAPVQIDKTAGSLAEMQREISSYVDGGAPATTAEVGTIVDNKLRSQPGAYETTGSVPGHMPGLGRTHRPAKGVA